jgi:hypothetical protein
MNDKPNGTSQINSPPQISLPILLTAAALLDFASCLLISHGPSIGPTILIILAEISLIALAIAGWVRYFHAYVDAQIEERLSRGSASDVKP